MAQHDGSSTSFGKPPNTFDGSKKDLAPFIQRLDVYIKLNPTKFPNAATKILFTTTYLTGPAETWVRPYLKDYLEQETASQEEDTRALFDTYTGFKDKLKTIFGAQDEEREAERRIMTLTQTGTVQEYATQFRALMAVLNWGDGVSVPFFRNGLKTEIRREFIHKTIPDKVATFIEEAISVDNKLREFREENKGPRVVTWAKHQHKPNTGKPRFYGGPMPMDLDNANKKRNTFKKGPLSQAERERRIKNNLCLYCGKEGHIANDCFAKKGKKPFIKGKPRQFGMAETSREPTVTWADSVSDPDNSNHGKLHWSGCYDDQCLTHQADKDLGYYPRKEANKVKQRSQTPMPINRALCCADGPKAEVVTMDEGRLEITSYTEHFAHAKTYYYHTEWCKSEYCQEDAQHQHTWYNPRQARKNIPAFVKLGYCIHPRCTHQNKGWNHIHLNNDYEQRTLTVDDDTKTGVIEPAIQMSGINFPTCDLEDEGGPDYDDGSLEIPETPEPYPYPVMIDDIWDSDFAAYKFLCVWPETCDHYGDEHTHLMHFDPRDLTRPISSDNAGRILEERGECKLKECPYHDTIGRHLHWSKNE